MRVHGVHGSAGKKCEGMGVHRVKQSEEKELEMECFHKY